MKTNALLLIVSLALGFASCAHPRMGTRRIETARIEIGVTTEQQLVDQLGEPQGRGFDFKRRKMLTWNRLDVRSTDKTVWMPGLGQFLPSADTVHEQQLVVSFDPLGRVVNSRVTNERHRYR
jgi:hypothetical protein